MTDRSNESLISLVRSLPGLITDLIKAEIEQAKTKAIHMGKYAGIGAGFFVGALIFIYFAIGVLVAVGILALALVLPAWLAALIVFVVFVLIAVVLALVGLSFFKKIGQDPNPVESVKQDVDALKGMGSYDR
ncbi:phage holin family protein [Paramicrobacterium agarici]|uniref:Putative superfamily III holin-X n=1 Tax=Paramicrobacterium agarici TaxID=630514 RepID=A0A2A9DSD1_9MICO|nr:phage holin family protein [Microbacterium agarici]PFG29493.1 putative superfamily III holin-X [Microbacterium agarici]TQO22498.1 putative superfamily III holin-X [Microbacterium agarici]